MRYRPTVAAIAMAVLLIAAGCGADDGGLEDAGSDEIVTISSAHWGIEYYGACGNESVAVDGVTYYPLLPDERQRLSLGRYPASIAEQVELLGEDEAGLRAIQRVESPGPGDDVGKMLIYADGTARFESNSGRVLWLSDTPKTYEWEC